MKQENKTQRIPAMDLVAPICVSKKKITFEETPAGSWLLSQHTRQHTECCFTFLVLFYYLMAVGFGTKMIIFP